MVGFVRLKCRSSHSSDQPTKTNSASQPTSPCCQTFQYRPDERVGRKLYPSPEPGHAVADIDRVGRWTEGIVPEIGSCQRRDRAREKICCWKWISELLAPLNARGKLSSYIDLLYLLFNDIVLKQRWNLTLCLSSWRKNISSPWDCP